MQYYLTYFIYVGICDILRYLKKFNVKSAIFIDYIARLPAEKGIIPFILLINFAI